MYSSPSFSSYQLMVRCVSCLLPSTCTVFFFRFYLWLCWVFLAVWAFPFLSCRVGATLQLQCMGFSLLASPAPRHGLQRSQVSVLVSRGLCSCSSQALEHRLDICGTQAQCCTSCGILLDQGSNRPCFLYWQVDSLPLSHQGSPLLYYFETNSRSLSFQP